VRGEASRRPRPDAVPLSGLASRAPLAGERRLRPTSTRATLVFARTVFPATVVASLAAASALMRAGLSPELSVGPVVALAFALIAGCERIFPYERAWLRPRGDVATDLGLAALNGAVTGALQPAVVGAGVLLARAATGVEPAAVWPDHWPIAAQLGLALLVGELFEYTAHRAMHEVPWLWRFHAPHHSAERLYWLNALRFHPVDIALVGPGKLLPVAALGADARVFALVTVFAAVHGAFQHANVELRLGPLNWVFSMAELHRWHHSPRLEEANHNYGGNLILWDVVFGTRWLPRDRRPPVEIGIESLPAFPRSLPAILLAPFRWERVVAAAASLRPA